MPNPYGGKGLPKYVKQANGQQNHYGPQNGADDSAAPAVEVAAEAAPTSA